MSVALDIEDHTALEAYLHQSGRIAVGERPVMRTLTGGVSNRTVLVRRPGGETWVVKQALEKLRVAVDWFSNPSRIEREALGIHWLGRLAPPGSIPRYIFEDRDHHLVAMAAVPEPHDNWKLLLLSGQVHEAHIRQFGELLGTIHSNAYEHRTELAELFRDRSFFESLRIEPYYAYTASQVAESIEFYKRLIADTQACLLTLVHGDYSPKNILIHGDRLVLLDHEVIHFGDPAFDLGFSLTHLLSKAHHLPSLRTDFAVATLQYWQFYRSALGSVPWKDDLEARAVRHALGCLLGRVRGRSTLEYLAPAERTRQQQAVVPLMHNPPPSVPELVAQFLSRLEGGSP